MRPLPDPTETLRLFETRAPEPFHMGHAEHIAVAWCYLQTMPLLQGLNTMIQRIRDFSESRGVPERYHETVTWAWYLLIHERLERTGRDTSWETFAVLHPDLLDGSALAGYYRPETLDSPLARRVFVLPDRPLPALSDPGDS